MRVECPNCGAKGQIDESKRPPGASSLRCPQCGGSIALDGGGAGSADPIRTEPTVPPPPQSAPTLDPPETVQTVTNFCSVCNNSFPREEMVRFGPSLICSACKPMYVQMLEQGSSHPGSFRYGGFWIRVAAKIIDGLILTVINIALSFLVAMLITTTNDPASAIIAAAVSTFLNLVIAIALTTWFLGSFGATPGKMAVGLMVVHPDGSRITYWRAFGRYFAEILSSLILGIGYLMAAFDDEKRALHDRICDTRVVYK